MSKDPELARLEALTEAQRIVFGEGCVSLLNRIKQLEAEVWRLNCRIAETQILALHNDPDKRTTVRAKCETWIYHSDAVVVIDRSQLEASRRLVLSPSSGSPLGVAPANATPGTSSNPTKERPQGNSTAECSTRIRG